MKESLSHLVEALREELQQFGEMLALLDHQQELIIQRNAAELLHSLGSINAQTAVIEVARRQREKHQRTVAGQFQLPADATFEQIASVMPNEYRLLVEALVTENNHCLLRVRQRGRQNQLLLGRSLQFMQRLIGTVLSATQTTTYQGDGKLAVSVVTGRPLCDAVG